MPKPKERGPTPSKRRKLQEDEASAEGEPKVTST